jgi:hypothetical protein
VREITFINLHLLTATGLIVLCVAIVLWMKLISYAYSNKEYRESLEKGQPFCKCLKKSVRRERR